MYFFVIMYAFLQNVCRIQHLMQNKIKQSFAPRNSPSMINGPVPLGKESISSARKTDNVSCLTINKVLKGCITTTAFPGRTQLTAEDGGI